MQHKYSWKRLFYKNKTESKISPRSRAKELLKFIKLFKPFKLCRTCPIISCFRQYNMHKINSSKDRLRTTCSRSKSYHYYSFSVLEIVSITIVLTTFFQKQQSSRFLYLLCFPFYPKPHGSYA